MEIKEVFISGYVEIGLLKDGKMHTESRVGRRLVRRQRQRCAQRGAAGRSVDVGDLLSCGARVKRVAGSGRRRGRRAASGQPRPRGPELRRSVLERKRRGRRKRRGGPGRR